MSPRPWVAERDVDVAQAAHLIASAFEDPAGQPVVPLEQGWDNSVFLVSAARAPGGRRRPAARPDAPRVAAGDVGVRPRTTRPARHRRHLGRRPRRVQGQLEEADRLEPPTVRAFVVHGDLHVRHLLVDDAGVPAGVIDWGDACLGDPAIDLSIAYAAFCGDARQALLAQYGGIDPEREVRARALAVRLSALLAVYAAHDGREGLLVEALAGLRRAVT